MNIKAFIIDDEENSRIGLKNMLVKYCKNVTVVGEAGTVKRAVESIKILQPDVVFLDIIMPKENGFELFNYFENPKFEVVFSTAYNEYAVKAFQTSAIDYLLKPIDLDLLKLAVGKVKDRKSLESQAGRISVLEANLNSSLEKISLPTSEGYLYMDIKNIVFCEAEGNYTHVHFKDESKFLVSKTLKAFEMILSDLHFFRINRSQLVNLKCIKIVGRQRNPQVILDDGKELVMSNFRKEDFFKKMGKGI